MGQDPPPPRAVSPDRLGELFTDVNVERWDVPLLELPSVAFARKRGARRRPRPKRWR